MNEPSFVNKGNLPILIYPILYALSDCKLVESKALDGQCNGIHLHWNTSFCLTLCTPEVAEVYEVFVLSAYTPALWLWWLSYTFVYVLNSTGMKISLSYVHE
jgi:hypothetical protein